MAAVALAAGVAALSAGSAAGAQTTPTKKWAAGVCSAVQTWLDDVDSTVQGLRSAASLDAAITSAEAGIRSATDDLTSTVDDLGRPQSEDGKKAQTSVEKLVTDLEDVASSVEETLADPPSDAVAVAATFATIGNELGKAQKALQRATTALEGLDPAGDLEKAFQSSSSCKNLERSASRIG